MRDPGARYVRIRNFETFQHYKDRCPPWIKLYARLWRDRNFQKLSDQHKAHLIGLFSLASQHENRLLWDEEWIAQELVTTTPLDLQALINSGFIIPIKRKRDASTELADCRQEPIAETYKEYKEETDSDLPSEDHLSLGSSSAEREVITAWNAAVGATPIRKLDTSRKNHLRARLAERDWPWRDALAKFPLECYRNRDNGKPGSRWKPNFDWFVKPGTADRIVEGKYDFSPGSQKNDLPPREKRLATDDDKKSYIPHG